MENNWNEKGLTGYPSIDKPWLKYYSEEAINAPLPECTIYEYLWENNKDHLDDIALVYFGRKITYKELFENIDKVAKSFYAIGVKQGDIVAMCITNTPESVYCFYAVNKLGAISNMIDLRLSAPELLALLNELDNKFLVLLNTCYKNTSEIIEKSKIEQAIVITPFHSLPWPISRKNKYVSKNKKFMGYSEFIKFGKNKQIITVSFGSEKTAVIEHTGGTTGVPKGVEISNKSMISVALQYKISGMHMHRGETFLCMVPPFILNGLCTCLNLPLSVCVAVKLIPQFNQKDFPKYLKSKPEHVIAAPSWWERLSHNKHMKNMDLSFLLTAATGGDGINAENERKLNNFLKEHNSKSILLNGYGMTELGSSVCTGMNHCNCVGSIGIPLPKMTLAIFDENEIEMRYNERGELCVSGPSLMNGYCGKASYETNNIKKTHKDGLIWVHTGDMAHITEDGFVFIDGRIKRIIICEGGFKVFPNLVEDILMKINGVQDCAVVGMNVSSDLTGQVPVAFIIALGNQQIIERQCFDICKENLADHCVPEKIFFLSELPLTPVGKVDYRALEKLAEENF